MDVTHRDFINKIKANGTESDFCDLSKVHDECKLFLNKLSGYERGTFALNVLCILCRNIDKVPSWKEKVDNKALLSITIDCVSETQTLGQADSVKALACIYHIHKHVTKQKNPLPPELIFKLSYMPFTPKLLTDYSKTYWSILVDRLNYIELLKSKRVDIKELLPKLTEDILKTIDIYETILFCSNVLTYLIKKLHFLFTEKNYIELNKTFYDIFDRIVKKNDCNFKKLKTNDLLDMYIKFNDCLYVVIENNSKSNFEGSNIDLIVNFFIILIGHNSDIFHTFQTYYSNIFNNIFNNKNNNSNYTEMIFNNLLITLNNIEKDTKIINATLPFLIQLLKFYIEYTINNNKWTLLTSNTYTLLLQIIKSLMLKSKKCNQLLKCENCNSKTGLHDALRLSLLIKHFIVIPINNNTSIKDILPVYKMVVEEQYNLLNELNITKCCNHEKYFRKQQTDVHNTSITLYKANYYEYSIKLFDLYLKYEFKCIKSDADFKNISRALYNKAICELDILLFGDALKNAFLSLIFARDNNEKYMSLVMDIKAKSLKASDEIEANDIQLMSVVEACECALNSDYGYLKPFFKPLKFSVLLKHEFDMYAKLWPSIVPVAGVWRSLYDVVQGKYPWITVENEETIQWTLYEVVMETPRVVRTIHNGYYQKIVTELLERLDKSVEPSPALKVVHATLMFLKAEYSLHEASEKYGWKPSEPSMDLDRATVTRTIKHEHEATRHAIQAVNIWSDIMPQLEKLPKTKIINNCLHIADMFVQNLLHLCRDADAVNLAHICCSVAQYLGDRLVYVRNAGTLLSHAHQEMDHLTQIASIAAQYCTTLDKAAKIEYICDVAIHSARCGKVGLSAKLVQHAQAQILSTKTTEHNNLDFAIGKLMEAQWVLSECGDFTGPSALSTVNGIQRHYLSLINTETKWSPRRLVALQIRRRLAASSVSSARLASSLHLPRRARASAAAALPTASAITAVQLLGLAAQIKTDIRINYILGLDTNSEQYNPVEPEKPQNFIPKQDIETMLENMTFKRTLSPTLPCLSVPMFKTPKLLQHTNCNCYSCDIQQTCIYVCMSICLEAIMYYRAKEIEISRNYFDGALKCFNIAENKLKNNEKHLKNNISDVNKKYIEILKNYEVLTLIEAALFELTQNNQKQTDEYIIRIHEIENTHNIDKYLKNEVLNLILTSANIRKTKKVNLEIEFDNLKLTPTKVIEVKTPERNIKPPEIINIVVKDEEVPKNRRKVIKLNLDEQEEAPKVTKVTHNEFKVPTLKTTKHVPEIITPRVTRKYPDIVITEETPKDKFFTPHATPEQFFTPLSNIKTYSKKSLRSNLVKNLEAEFSTPKTKETAPKSKDLTVESKMAEKLTDENKMASNTLTAEKKMAENLITEKKMSDKTIESDTIKTVKSKIARKTLTVENNKAASLTAEKKKSDKTVESDTSIVKSKLAPKNMTAEKKMASNVTAESDTSKLTARSKISRQNVTIESKMASLTIDKEKTKSNRLKSLKRATSPGKLEASSSTSRLRRPTKFSVHEDSKTEK